MILVAPSILSADFAHLADDLASMKASGADWIHYDVMDGQFVPNISFGMPILKAIRGASDLFIDAHLMIVDPQNYAGQFCKAGADMVTVHVEASSKENIRRALDIIKSNGKKCGVVVKPMTGPEGVREYLPDIDMVLVMTVEPGFGGQSFMADQMEKVSKIRTMIDEINPGCRLEVDGGINAETAAVAVGAGADVLVAGSYFFGAADRTAAVDILKG